MMKNILSSNESLQRSVSGIPKDWSVKDYTE